jgi:hypothetical protein
LSSDCMINKYKDNGRADELASITEKKSEFPAREEAMNFQCRQDVSTSRPVNRPRRTRARPKYGLLRPSFFCFFFHTLSR